jgi:hypothetical protein
MSVVKKDVSICNNTGLDVGPALASQRPDRAGDAPSDCKPLIH